MCVCDCGCAAQNFEAAVGDLATVLQNESQCALLTFPATKVKEMSPRELDNLMHMSCDAVLEIISRVEGTAWKLQALHKVHMASGPSGSRSSF